MQQEMDPELDLDGRIWRFALAFYEIPGVSEACLKLQDQAEMDVVSLIAVLYADAVLGRHLSADELSTLRREMARWREETVLPLRRLRRELKSPPDKFPPAETEALRNIVKKAELKAEQIQLGMTDRWLRLHPARTGLTVEAALGLLTETTPGPSERVLGQLIAAARRAEPIVRPQ